MATDDQQPPNKGSSDPSLPFPGVGQTWLLLLAYQGSQIIVAVVFAVVMALVFLARGEKPENLTSGSTYVWIMAVASAAAVGLLFLAGKAKAKRGWSEVAPFLSFDWRLAAVIPLVGIGLQLLLSEADTALQLVLPAPDWLMEAMLEMVGSGAASFFLLVIVAPFTEEVLFRGLVWQGYVRRYGPRNAVLYSALMFAVWHLNPYQMLGAFVIGLVLGWLRHWTGSLWPCIWLHALGNSVSFFGWLIVTGIPGFAEPLEPSFMPWWLDLSGLVLAGLGLFLLWRLLEKKRPVSKDGRIEGQGGPP
jgi:hypothetical protein